MEKDVLSRLVVVEEQTFTYLWIYEDVIQTVAHMWTFHYTEEIRSFCVIYKLCIIIGLWPAHPTYVQSEIWINVLNLMHFVIEKSLSINRFETRCLRCFKQG